MTTIRVNYGVMASGHEGLVATWNRIEAHLGQLDTLVAATTDMQSEALTAYLDLKAQWSTSAADRQVVLQALAASVDNAAQAYRQVDAAAAAQFLR